MDKRKQALLEITIEEYIHTAEPVGSKTLSNNNRVSVSPATVRTELNELEKEGYLTHVHTSSGRVPTDKGYRLYVDSLMAPSSLSEPTLLENTITTMGDNIESITEKMVQILSKTLNYTTIALTPDLYQETLKVIHLILVDLDKVLVVILNSVGVNQEFLLNITDRIDQSDLNRMSTYLTEKLKGESITTLNDTLLKQAVSLMPQFKAILNTLHKEVETLTEKQEQRLLFKGASKMLKLPEFKDIELTKRVLSGLEETKLMTQILKEYLAKNKGNVMIGTEIQNKNLEDCSIVISPVNTENPLLGSIGLLGPKRMPYNYLVPLIKSISKKVHAASINQD